MSADRRRGFESWARTGGDAAVRPHDRRGIAEDIFDVAGAADVSPLHIEEVSKRYRERLAGAQKILLARQVGDEILRWQREPQKAAVSRSHDSRREDDEIIGIQLDSMSLSMADVARAVAATNAGAQAPSAPEPAREAGRSEPPASSSLGARGATPSRLASPAQWGNPLSRASSSPEPPGAGSPPSPPSSPPERARSEGAVDWAGAARAPASSAPKADHDEPGLWAPRRGTSQPAPRDSASPDLPPLGLPPPGPTPLSSPPLGPPATSTARGAISVPPIGGAAPSRPPSFGEDLSSSVAPSRPPSRRPRALDAAAPAFEIDGDSNRASSAAPSSAESAPWPGHGPSRFAVPRTAPSAVGITRKQGMIAGGLLAGLVLALIVWRTGVALRDRPTEVTGHTVSAHLGLSLLFAEPWTHERKRDDDRGHLGFRRATSTYFQGVTPEDFLMQLTLVSLTPEDHPASVDDVRKIGATELIQTATERTCAPLGREEGAAFRCLAKATYKARSFAVLEEYFLVGSRVVYARAMVEALADVAPGPPKPGEAVTPIVKQPLIAKVDEDKIQAILDSIQPL